jgi:hypothetical protein
MIGNFILLDGLIVTNGSASLSRLSSDVTTSFGDVATLIGLAIIGAIILGVLYAIYLILTQGD